MAVHDKLLALESTKEMVDLAEAKFLRESEELKDLEKRLVAQRARVEADKKKLEEANSKLKRIEDQLQVIDVDGGANAFLGADHGGNMNSSTVCFNTPNSASAVNANSGFSLPTIKAGNGKASNNANCNGVSDNVTSGNDESGNICLFREIFVEGCAEPGVNGSYRLVQVNRYLGNTYSKRGVYNGEMMEFKILHSFALDGSWFWQIDESRSGNVRTLYLSRSQHKLKNLLPQGRSWVDVRGPSPKLSGCKMNQSDTHCILQLLYDQH